MRNDTIENEPFTTVLIVFNKNTNNVGKQAKMYIERDIISFTLCQVKKKNLLQGETDSFKILC